MTWLSILTSKKWIIRAVLLMTIFTLGWFLIESARKEERLKCENAGLVADQKAATERDRNEAEVMRLSDPDLYARYARWLRD